MTRIETSPMLRSSPRRCTADNRPADREVLIETAAGLPLDRQAISPVSLLTGGEEIILAVKPSGWFLLLVSWWWIVVGITVGVGGCLLLRSFSNPGGFYFLCQCAIWVVGGRVLIALLQWMSRIYILTNRRVMRIRGLFSVNVMQIDLPRVSDVRVSGRGCQKLLRVGDLIIEGEQHIMGWDHVARPVEIQQQILDTAEKAKRLDSGNG